MAQVFLIALLLLVFPLQSSSKDLSSRFFYMGFNFAALYGQDHAEPNTSNPSANINLSDVEAFPATGTGLHFGFEIMSSLPVSFFMGLDYNYMKDASDSSVRRGVIVNSATLTHFKQKLRIHEVVAEGGININLKTKNDLWQFFGSFGLGMAYRFERLAYSSSDADIQDFLRESRSDSFITRLSGGVRYINQKRFFFETKLSLTTLTINQQFNSYVIINNGGATATSGDAQELADIDDEKAYASIYLGGGYFF